MFALAVLLSFLLRDQKSNLGHNHIVQSMSCKWQYFALLVDHETHTSTALDDRRTGHKALDHNFAVADIAEPDTAADNSNILVRRRRCLVGPDRPHNCGHWAELEDRAG